MSEAEAPRDTLRQFAEAIKHKEWAPSTQGNWSDVCDYIQAAHPKTILAMFEVSEEWRLLASAKQNWKDLFFAERASLDKARLMLRLMHAQHTLEQDQWMQDLLDKVRAFLGPLDDEQWQGLLDAAKEEI